MVTIEYDRDFHDSEAMQLSSTRDNNRIHSLSPPCQRFHACILEFNVRLLFDYMPMVHSVAGMYLKREDSETKQKLSNSSWIPT